VLHGPHLGALHVQGDRLNGFPLQLAHLAGHILMKVLPRLLTGKTIGKLGVKSFELFHKKGQYPLCRSTVLGWESYHYQLDFPVSWPTSCPHF
jgi:hypothetical protein